MTFTLYVDGPRWRAHQRRVLAELPGLVPVAKGNGYGVGNELLGAEAGALGVATVAVGTDREVADVRRRFDGDVLVLTPIAPTTAYGEDPQVIRTVARAEHLPELPPSARVVVECRTAMNRHGIVAEELAQVLDRSDLPRIEGFALHHPLDRAHADPVAETRRWLSRLGEAGLRGVTLWVSHLSAADIGVLRAEFPHAAFRPRVGTRLWHGERSALTARGTVLDVESLRRGQRSGYRQHPAPGKGHLVVVSGGTAHGVALEAPRAVHGVAARAQALALGALEAAGRNLSPFSWAGKHRWFIEPPHMQVSLVFIPDSVAPPALGTELECRVRLTTVHPDAVVIV